MSDFKIVLDIRGQDDSGHYIEAELTRTFETVPWPRLPVVGELVAIKDCDGLEVAFVWFYLDGQNGAVTIWLDYNPGNQEEDTYKGAIEHIRIAQEQGFTGEIDDWIKEA